jgi:hypothetical protein
VLSGIPGDRPSVPGHPQIGHDDVRKLGLDSPDRFIPRTRDATRVALPSQEPHQRGQEINVVIDEKYARCHCLSRRRPSGTEAPQGGADPVAEEP